MKHQLKVTEEKVLKIWEKQTKDFVKKWTKTKGERTKEIW